MTAKTYIPTFADLEELQVLFKTIGDTADAALDNTGLRDSALWMISKLSDVAARDIEHLLSKELGPACRAP